MASDKYPRGSFVHDNLPGGLGYTSLLSCTRITLRTTHHLPLPCLAVATFQLSGDRRFFCACHSHVEETPRICHVKRKYFPMHIIHNCSFLRDFYHVGKTQDQTIVMEVVFGSNHHSDTRRLRAQSTGTARTHRLKCAPCLPNPPAP